MTDINRFNQNYAYLPGDLLVKILEGTPAKADKLRGLIGYDETKFSKGLDILKSQALPVPVIPRA